MRWIVMAVVGSFAFSASLRPAAAEDLCWIDNGVGKAPSNVPPVIGDGYRLGADGSTILSPAIARDVERQLLCYWRWQQACQASIDAFGDVRAAELRAAMEALDISDARIQELEGRGAGIPWWIPAVVGLAIGAAGVSAAALLLR